MIELAAVGLGIAFEKEMQWLVANDAIGPGKGDCALDQVLGPQGALRPERLDALVIAIDRTPAVRDLAQRTRLRTQCHDRRVDIARFADRRIDQHARGGKYLDRLLAQEPPRHVEIVDHHVAEQAARTAYIFDRRRSGIAAGDRQQLEAAAPPAPALGFEPHEARVKAAAEADPPPDTPILRPRPPNPPAAAVHSARR